MNRSFKTLMEFVDNKSKITYSMILATIGEIIGLMPYYFIAKIVGLVLKNDVDLNYINYLILYSIFAYIFKFLFTYKSTLISHSIAFLALKNIRLKITNKMSKVQMGYILDKSVGEFKNLIVDQVSKLEDSIAHILPEFVSDVIAPLCTIIYIFMIDWRIGLASLVSIPIGLLFYIGLFNGYEQKMKDYTRVSNNMNSNLVEYINGIKVIKMFSEEKSSYKKFFTSVNDYHQMTMNWWKQSWFWNAASKAIMPSTLLFTLPLSSYFYMIGQITIETFLLSIVLPLAFISPLLKITVFMEELSFINESLSSIKSFLDIKEIQRPKEIVNLNDEGFEFNNVSFAYEDENIIKNVSFKTKTNGMTAIVGPSGSGKSTLAKLMAGFWEANEGFIKYGGVDVENISTKQLMDEISYVSQDNFLFDMSIIENIKMGKSDATYEEVIQACKKANAHEFILSLKNGYETTVGDAGGKLSGGERQRITLARAILKDSKTIILDEATAYADPETDYLIQNAIREMIKNKNVIIIAHRLATIIGADQIIVLKDGQIEAKNKHNDLMKSSILYKNLWEKDAIMNRSEVV
ncbi:ABC transporter ATP-binding protein [Peptostreptococcaceae bacterium AGR-M142]